MEVFVVIFVITAVQLWAVCNIYVLKNIIRGVKWFMRDIDEDKTDKEQMKAS